jgi:diadenosine tetraphosphate (Ap4A) HIT family hydrolase
MNLLKKLEKALLKAFNATMFNWTCLMNNAYLEKPPKPHIHWHFRPRYEHPVNFGGMTFFDKEFGRHYKVDSERCGRVPNSIRKKIIERILDNITKD